MCHNRVTDMFLIERNNPETRSRVLPQLSAKRQSFLLSCIGIAQLGSPCDYRADQTGFYGRRDAEGWANVAPCPWVHEPLVGLPERIAVEYIEYDYWYYVYIKF